MGTGLSVAEFIHPGGDESRYGGFQAVVVLAHHIGASRNAEVESVRQGLPIAQQGVGVGLVIEDALLTVVTVSEYHIADGATHFPLVVAQVDAGTQDQFPFVREVEDGRQG